MDYILTLHAKKRMRERSIAKQLLEEALQNPTKALYDNEDKLLIKKLYKIKNKERLLLIVGEKGENRLKIFTIIDTSKVRKYL